MKQMLSTLPIVLFISIIFSSCKNNEKRDAELVTILDSSTYLMLDLIFNDAAHIESKISDRGNKKSEVDMFNTFERMLENTRNILSKIDEGKPDVNSTLNSFKLTKDSLVTSLIKEVGGTYGIANANLLDSLSLSGNASELEKSIIKYNLIYSLKSLALNFKVLMGPSGLYFGTTHRAEFEFDKNGENQILLFPEERLLTGATLEIYNLKFNTEDLTDTPKKIGNAYYIKFKSEVKEKNVLSYRSRYIYKGDTILDKDFENQFKLND